MKKLLTTFLIVALLTSCESKQARKERIEFEQKQNETEKAEAIHLEKVRIEQEEADRIEREAQLEKERKEKTFASGMLDRTEFKACTDCRAAG